MTRTDDTLSTLDAAPAVMTAAERERAGALLERIVTEAAGPVTGSGPAGPVRTRQARRSWRPRRRLLLVPLAVVALAVPLVLAPSPGPDRAAYASWTSAPAAVDDRSLAAATSACRSGASEQERTDDAERAFDPKDVRQVLAERRGEFVAVVLWSPTTDAGVRCLVRDPSGTGSVDLVDVGSIDDGGWGTLAPGTFRTGGITDRTGSATPPAAWWQPYVDRLAGVLTGSGEEGQSFRGSVVDGLVGEGVSGVTVHAGGYTVEATVAGGKLVAWWPGPAVSCYPQDTGVLRCDPIMTYDLHLADGTTITGATPDVSAR